MDTLQAILKINSNAKVNIIKEQGQEEVITWLDGTAEISQADIEVVLSKGKVFQQKDSNNVFVNIMLYDKKVFYCATEFFSNSTQNTCKTWVSEDKE